MDKQPHWQHGLDTLPATFSSLTPWRLPLTPLPAPISSHRPAPWPIPPHELTLWTTRDSPHPDVSDVVPPWAVALDASAPCTSLPNHARVAPSSAVLTSTAPLSRTHETSPCASFCISMAATPTNPDVLDAAPPWAVLLMHTTSSSRSPNQTQVPPFSVMSTPPAPLPARLRPPHLQTRTSSTPPLHPTSFATVQHRESIGEGTSLGTSFRVSPLHIAVSSSVCLPRNLH